MTPNVAIQVRMWGLDRLATDYPQIFDEITEAGYDGVESRYTLVAEPHLGKYLADHPLRLIALHANLKSFAPQAEQPVDIAWLLEKMNELGSEYLLVSLGEQPDYGVWFELAARLSQTCKAHGVQFCYHNHAGEFAASEAFFDELTNYGISLAADLAWVWRAGENVVDFVERYKHSIKYVHVKDATADTWKELGEGEVALGDILPRVTELNLPWWTVEQDTTDRRPLDSARISRAYLESRLGV